MHKKEELKVNDIFTGKKILIIEDIKINRDIVRMMLEKTGVAMDFAENGITALELFNLNHESYDLIITDINMPEMDGYEAVKRIRSSGEKGKNIPIIAMTANVHKTDFIKSLSAGMNDHIGKPAKEHELIKKMSKLMKIAH
jgi:CheY-like chemotaxis protein